MEEEMVEEEEYCFTAYEIDIDYEFDASRFFDFTRAESLPEARTAESWFDSAPSCPPSPFAAGLIPRAQTLMDNINVSPKTKGVEVENMNLSDSESDLEVDAYSRVVQGKNKGTFCGLQTGSSHRIQNAPQNLPSGLTFYNHMVNNTKSNNQSKMSTKPSFPRTSTLMKPTASQLAKQNHPFQTGHPRPNTFALEKLDKSSVSNFGVENQAAKRQKLEGGLQRKVIGGVQLQQTNFIHKATKREGILDGNISYAKSRITIPREPDLETAHRAQRTRTNSTKDTVNPTSTVRRFKALPLNRKILEVPSLLPKRSTPQIPNFQEFHLKTSERAIQHLSAAALTSRVPCSNKATNKHNGTSKSECGNREASRPSIMSVSRPDGCESSHNFKALPLNRKILTSKGDIGVFRNKKKETTVQMEFNFQTERKYNPPIDLFNKLSLVPETQQHTVDKSIKGSKENHQLSYFNTGNETTKPPGKLKHQHLGVEAACGSGWSKDMR